MFSLIFPQTLTQRCEITFSQSLVKELECSRSDHKWDTWKHPSKLLLVMQKEEGGSIRTSFHPGTHLSTIRIHRYDFHTTMVSTHNCVEHSPLSPGNLILTWVSASDLLLNKCMCVLSHSVVSDSLWPYGLEPARLFCPWGFSRQEYWSGLPCPPPKDLSNPGIKPRSPTLQADSLLPEPPGKPKNTGVGSLSLLQGLSPTQESNLHYRRILYQLNYQVSPNKCIG